MRVILCAVLCASIAGSAVGQMYVGDPGATRMVIAALGPGLAAALLTWPDPWTKRFQINAFVGVIAAAVSVGFGAMLISPTEYDNNQWGVVVVSSVLGGLLATAGMVTAAPVAWAVSWLASRRGATTSS